MRHLNCHATRQSYGPPLRDILNVTACEEAGRRLSSWKHLSGTPTPAWSLPALAASLGVRAVTVKDESRRSTLGSFKALGAPNALLQLVLRRKWPHRWDAESLLAGRHAAELRDFVVTSATDGNHGRALAAAAQSIGCRCVIVLHGKVSEERESAIAAFGAEIVRVAGDYDDSVREAARLALEHGWEVVSDTSYAGYEEVPRDVMQGYGLIAQELIGAESGMGLSAYTHVILQGGVGGFAAGIASHFWERLGPRRPFFIVVEPHQADCLYQSALAGKPARATGSVDSIMAGLACGEASPLAWRFLQPVVDLFMTVEDDQAADAVRRLSEGRDGDIPIVSGESGAAGMAALLDLAATPEWRHKARIHADSHILLISTEGATAPAVYASVAGRSHEAVMAAQQDWLSRGATASAPEQPVEKDSVGRSCEGSAGPP